jgi:hypothetical protein
MSVETSAMSRGTDRRFYTWAAMGAIAIVFAGFARTYFLKTSFGTPALSTLVHVHGLVMTLWFTFFLMQVRLVAMRRTHLHRRAGVVGALVAAAVLIVGIATAITAARLGRSPGPPPLVFLVVPLGDMLVFALLVGAGLYLRSRPDMHRRLMLLSCVGMLTAAIARIPIGFIQAGGLPVFFGLTDLVVLACVAYDTTRQRRLHPAFGWGMLLIVASQPLRLLLSGTSVWQQFASWLVS